MVVAVLGTPSLLVAWRVAATALLMAAFNAYQSRVQIIGHVAGDEISHKT